MAIETNKSDGELIFKIDNGELNKIEEAMEKWRFKDHKSFLMFCLGLLLLNENKSFGIKINGFLKEIGPADELVEGN